MHIILLTHIIIEYLEDGEMSTYSYPDNNDSITAQYIEESEPFLGYWHESEQRILALIDDIIKNELTGKKELSFLDAGCGEGRLLSRFQSVFSRITAIEPDINRILKAQESAEKERFSHKVDFLNMMITDIDESQLYDVILCSHVLQHVHTDSLDAVIAKFRNLLKPNGLLFIFTCHSTKDTDYFTKSFVEHSKLIESDISQEEYNLLINSSNILPTHFFKKESIISLLSDNSLAHFAFNVFHCTENISDFSKNSENLDEIINKSEHYQSTTGRDLFIAAKLV